MIQRTAIKRKRSKPRRGPVKDAKYLAWLRTLPCCVCSSISELQNGKTEAAHVGSRGLGQKCNDREALPICSYDHREGMFAAHRMGNKFWTHHGLDRDALIAEYNRRFDLERE